MSNTAKFICTPDEIVPAGLRQRLRWDDRHDAMATLIMRKFSLTLPRDRELIRQLTFVRVVQGPLPWLEDDHEEEGTSEKRMSGSRA